jgi:hypothetical protein
MRLRLAPQSRLKAEAVGRSQFQPDAHTQWFVKVMNDAQRQDIFASARGCASSLGSSQSLGTWKMANNARTDSAGAEWWPKLMQIRATLIAEIDAAD